MAKLPPAVLCCQACCAAAWLFPHVDWAALGGDGDGTEPDLAAARWWQLTRGVESGPPCGRCTCA